MSSRLAKTSDPTEPGARIDVEEIYRTYAPIIYRRILRFHDASEAEEVLHEVFVKIMERADDFRAESAPMTWIYRLTTNHCLNRARDQRRRAALLRERRDELFPAAHQRAVQPDALFWQELWRHVPAELLEIATLHYIDGLGHAEIARMYGVSRRTIGNRVQEFQRQVRALADPDRPAG